MTVVDEVVRMWTEAIKVSYKALYHRLYKGTAKHNVERHSKIRNSGYPRWCWNPETLECKAGSLFAQQEVCYMCGSHILMQGCDVFET